MRHRSPLRTSSYAGILLAVALAAPAVQAATAPGTDTARDDRFRSAGRVLDGAADWVALGTDLAAFGSGTEVTLTGGLPRMPLRARLSLDAPATGGALAGDALYVVQRHEGAFDRLVVLDLEAPGAGARPVRLEPAPRGRLHVARMDDHLLVAEDGFGLRILLLPHPGHASHGDSAHNSSHTRPAQVGLVPIEGTISAMTSSMRRIYLAVDGRLVVVDATRPALPGLAGETRLAFRVDALAANGPTVHALGPEGLRVVALDAPGGVGELHRAPGGTAVGELHRAPGGTAMALAGRSLFVAGGETGLHEVVDGLPTQTTHFVTVGDIFFDPSGTINVASGDRVQWDKPVTAFPHNVFSCNSAQFGCGGEDATETFISGGVTTASFTFSHIFTAAGPNRYLCQAHTAQMQGNIMVAAAAPAPPAVPDGDGATMPMTAGKLDAAGSDLSIAFDTSCPDAAGHDLVFGTGAGLPSALGGAYSPGGSTCAVGLVSPFTWTASPQPPVGQFLWWVLVADDGTDTEGSWGKDSAGGERDGPGTNGASGQCGNTDKTLANACGQ